MTAAFLQSELSSLISDSKRKHSDIKVAAEKSLADLRAIHVTSETQLAADLLRRQRFIDPFLLACKSQNVKLASSGAAALQRLIASTAVARPRLPDLLEAFQTAIPLAFEVQLKVLQSLPSLLQLYARDLHGEALAKTLGISADLSDSKVPLVSNTASATFQQLITTVFSSLTEDEGRSSGDNENHSTSQDAYAIFRDLCARVQSAPPEFVRLQSLSLQLTLESIENLLTNYGGQLSEFDEAKKACKTVLLPGLVDTMNQSVSFTAVVRSVRVVYLLTTQYIDSYQEALFDSLECLVKLLDRSSSNKWKRVVAFEFWRGICTESEILRKVFSGFDMNRKAGEKGIVIELMSALVRTSSEDPALIGLGRQSTIPTQAASEINGVADSGAVDLPGVSAGIGSVALSSGNVTGISQAWSNIPVPCLEQADKTAPPEIPETYIYTLNLSCVAAFSDGLSKYLMPLSMPPRRVPKQDASDDDTDAEPNGQPSHPTPSRSNSGASKYQHLLNPSERSDLSERAMLQVHAYSKMIEDCWPAVLATCSTFLNAALDSHYYHIVVRTVQKLTQVSGILALYTPRDALMTTLAKVCVPANVSSIMSALYGKTAARVTNTSDDTGNDTASLQSPVSETPRQSLDLSQPLNVRNLLCLRALLNLGIALGPTFGRSAWNIVFQALEQVEALTTVVPTTRVAAQSQSFQGVQASSGSDAASSLASEITAIDTARRRMLDSTKTYSDQAFTTITKSLFNMVEDIFPNHAEVDVASPTSNGGLTPSRPGHRATRSVSSIWAKTLTLEVEVQFVLKMIGRILVVNLFRLIRPQHAQSTWSSIIKKLLSVQTITDLQPKLRSQAADIVDALIVEVSKVAGSDRSEEAMKVIVAHALPTLSDQLESCTAPTKTGLDTLQSQMHQRLLETLENVISHCGDKIKTGWELVFDILNSSIENSSLSTELVSESFKITRMITSDFLSMLQVDVYGKLIQLLFLFSKQTADLNVSLTAIALFWNINSQILSHAAPLDAVTGASHAVTSETRPDPQSSSAIPVLWWQSTTNLALLCCDERVDLRNASIRLTTRIVEASLPQITPVNFSNYVSHLLLPTIQSCLGHDDDPDHKWTESGLALLCAGATTIKDHSDLLLQSSGCGPAMANFIKTIQSVCQQHRMNDIKDALTSLSEIVSALFASRNGCKVADSKDLLSSAWKVAVDCDPSHWISNKTSNSDALAARISVLIEVSSAWGGLVNKDDAVQVVDNTLRLAILPSYIRDINKMTNDQARVLDLLRLLSRGRDDLEDSFVRNISMVITRELQSTIGMYPNNSVAASTTEKRTSTPTKLAFISACLQLLSSHLSDIFKKESSLVQQMPIHEVLRVYSGVIATKYTNLPTNEADPIWKTAISAAADLIIASSKKSHHDPGVAANRSKNAEPIDASTSDAVAEQIAHLVENIIGSATEEAHVKFPSAETLVADQAFETVEFKRIHPAALRLFEQKGTSQTTRIKYILTLFRHSLVARPWYNDLPPDLEHSPLQNFTRIRPGSIRKPDLPIRREIWPVALDALFSLVNATRNTLPVFATEGSSPFSHLATLAAPYVLLRIAHTLKTFITDQSLRGYNPPPRALQAELNILLSKAVSLHVPPQAFTNIVIDGHTYGSTQGSDSKTHLRILYPLMAKFAAFWRNVPRLGRGLAWQEDEDGKGVERSLREWEGMVRVGWGAEFA